MSTRKLTWPDLALKHRPKSESPEVQVSVLVITYQPDADQLRRCITTVLTSSYPSIQLVLVDNSPPTTDVRSLLEPLLGSRPSTGTRRVTFAPQFANLGYAAATNVGISLCRGTLVLLLNPDAWLEPTTIRRLVDAAERRPTAAGFGPKILLADPGVVIDSVGICHLTDGQVVQRGLGQPDLGQYDIEEPIGGLCFAAALVRREAFSLERVGTLDDRYFMFYEDVDWSERAQVMGESFWSVPSARVHHYHSASTRSLGTGFKTRLIQRNLIWTALKNLESERAVRILVRRSLRAVKRTLMLREPSALMVSLLETWLNLPLVLLSRRGVQKRRRRRDSQFLLYPGDPTFFNSDLYKPDVSVTALLWALRRLNTIAPEPKLSQLLESEGQAASEGMPHTRAALVQRVRQSGVEITAGLDWMLRALETQSSAPASRPPK